MPAALRDGVVIPLAALVLLHGCANEPAPPRDAFPEERVPQQIIEGVHLRQSSVEGLEWVLDARVGESYGPEEPTRLTEPTVRFYEGEEVRSILTSDRGQIDENTRTFTAEGSVVVVTGTGARLETEWLRWDPKRERVTTEAFFRLTRDGDVLTGVGIDADPDLRRYTVHKDVRARLEQEDDTGILEALDADTTAGR